MVSPVTYRGSTVGEDEIKNCISYVSSFRFSSFSGKEWRFEFEPKQYCRWVCDSVTRKPVSFASPNLEETRRYLETLGVGDYLLAGMTGEGFVAVTDCAASRPLFVLRTGNGTEVVTNRLPNEPSGFLVEIVPGDMLLMLNPLGQTNCTFQAAAWPSQPDESTLLDRLKLSLERRVYGKSKVAVSFSGGLDSSLIAHLVSRKLSSRPRLILVTTYAKGYSDSVIPRRAAEMLDLELVEVPLEAEGCMQIIKGAGSRILWKSSMDAAIAIGFAAASSAARDLGCEDLLAGQGADEFFGGYRKYERVLHEPALLIQAMDKDQKSLYKGLARDAEAIRDGGCDPCFPYLDRVVIDYAKSIPANLRIKNGVRKAALREAAIQAGVPEAIAYAPKKAFQYSSGLEKMVRKLFTPFLVRG